MIVPMKKVTVVAQTKDAEATVKALKDLGVLHVEHATAPKGADINELNSYITLITNAMSVLSGPEFVKTTPVENGRHVWDWKKAAVHITNQWKRIDQLVEYSRQLAANIKEWERWGDFDPEEAAALEKKGIHIKLYEVREKDVDSFPKDAIVKKLFVLKGVAGVAAISRGAVEVPFKEKTLPKMRLKDMKARLAENNAAVQKIKGNITRHLRYRETFERIKLAIEKELEFHQAWRGMGEAGNISYINGYVPSDETGRVTDAAKKERWALLARDPSEDDNVPTLIRNPRWISIIAPMFKLITIVPGYRELDISPWFLIFFSIFFGMLIGDAGTGLVFMLLTFAAEKKLGGKVRDKSIFSLVYVLSGCAIVWGVLSGTFFGQAWLPQWVKPVLPQLRQDKSVIVLCFFIGAVHMTIGHTWRAILKSPALTALCDIGWTLIIWGAYFLAGYLVLDNAFPQFAKWLFIAGSVLVVFFTDPSRGILKGAPGGLGNLALNFMNNITDVISYVRLFAVGLASLAIADSFNAIASDIGLGSFGKSIVTALIAVFGQLLNVVLGPISVLVHGVRLNVLEFCSHVDIKWTGFLYKPLKEDPVK